MGIGDFIEALRRLVKEPLSAILVVGAVGALVLTIDYRMGFTHHYDVTSQIQELRALEEATPDSTSHPALDANLDSLRQGIAARMSARQRSLGEFLNSNPLARLVIRILASSTLWIAFFLYSTLATGIEDRFNQAVGSLMLAAIAIAAGILTPTFGGIWLTALLLVGLQILGFIALSLIGNYTK